MSQVMVDVEALALRSDAVIMSIGAVQFELDGSGDIGVKSAFYRSISIDSNLALGRKIDESTIVWWLQQDPAAVGVFHEAKVTLETALVDLQAWFPTGAKVWSNGASFDIPMLEHAYHQVDLEPPWPFWDSLCMRTYRSLPGAKNVERVLPKVAHNALQDAIAQALYVQAIHEALFNGVAA